MRASDVKPGDAIVTPGDGTTWCLVVDSSDPKPNLPLLIENFTAGESLSGIVTETQVRGLGVLWFHLITNGEGWVEVILGVGSPLQIISSLEADNA